MSPRSQEFLASAREWLDNARLSLEGGFPGAAASAAYCAMLYSARAARKSGITPSTIMSPGPSGPCTKVRLGVRAYGGAAHLRPRLARAPPPALLTSLWVASAEPSLPVRRAWPHAVAAAPCACHGGPAVNGRRAPRRPSPVRPSRLSAGGGRTGQSRVYSQHLSADVGCDVDWHVHRHRVVVGDVRDRDLDQGGTRRRRRRRNPG